MACCVSKRRLYNPRTVILSERANARDAKDLLMQRLALSARGSDQPTPAPPQQEKTPPLDRKRSQSTTNPTPFPLQPLALPLAKP